MSTRKTDIGGYLALIAILAAIWILFGENSDDTGSSDGGKLLSLAEGQIDLVDRISLKQGDLSLTLQREGERWSMADKGEYLADTSNVRAFLRDMVQAEKVEARTGDPDLLPKIGLGKNATKVMLEASGQLVASLDIGKQRTAGGGKQHAFVLVSGETESWLASGIKPASLDLDAWTTTRILPFRGADIAAIQLSDGKRIERSSAESPFRATAGDALDEWGPETLSGMLSRLAFTDLRKMANPLDEPIARIQVQGFDGTVIDMAFYRDAAGLWLQGKAHWSADLVVTGAVSSSDPAQAASDLDQRLSTWMYLVGGGETPDYLQPISAFGPKKTAN